MKSGGLILVWPMEHKDNIFLKKSDTGLSKDIITNWVVTEKETWYFWKKIVFRFDEKQKTSSFFAVAM